MAKDKDNQTQNDTADRDSCASAGYTGALWYADVMDKARAGRFQIWMARLFGVKRVANDIDRYTGINMQVTMYYFRGKYYVTECEYV